MDYELMMNNNLKIGQIAPDFKASTTHKEKSLEDFKQKWLVFFSYPGDFTNLSTIELIEFNNTYNAFLALNTEILGLSIDSLDAHFAWIKDIYRRTGIKIQFPLIADRSGEIARLYGMMSKDRNTETLRNVIIIDNKMYIRSILCYPGNIKRNVLEILRIIKVLQAMENK